MDTGQHTFFIGRFGLQILFVVVSMERFSRFIWATARTVSTPHQWFACAHLPGSHLPQSYAVTFPQRLPPWLLTTAA